MEMLPPILVSHSAATTTPCHLRRKSSAAERAVRDPLLECRAAPSARRRCPRGGPPTGDGLRSALPPNLQHRLKPQKLRSHHPLSRATRQ